MVSRRLSREAGHRRKFLAVIDETPECERAVAYASRRAKTTGGVLLLLFVIDSADFQQFLGVEQIMRAEAQERANSTLSKFAASVRETIGIEFGTCCSRRHYIRRDPEAHRRRSGYRNPCPGGWFRQGRTWPACSIAGRARILFHSGHGRAL